MPDSKKSRSPGTGLERLFSSLWLDRRLRDLSLAGKRRVTRAVVAMGVVAMAYYFSWWMEDGRLTRPLLLPVLFLAVVYGFVQVLSAWYVYTKIEIPPVKSARPGMAVDVLVPVFDESEALVTTSLKAALAIRYPHRTFLLDDGHRDELRALAEGLGAVYVRREDRRDNKAGNVNHALRLSNADFVAIFDVDHVASREYLDSVLGYFDDPGIGFVQPLVAHGNQGETYIARAASGQSDDIFGPTSMGWYGCGAAVVWGAHCVFRRAALDSIGGYQVGLAEDLHTSLALHAAGWESVYVPRVVTRGLATADLRAYFVQQLKWSRGVFEILFEKSLPLLRKLRPSQVVCYLTRMTYYLLGPVALVHMVALAYILFSGAGMNGYFLHFGPLLVAIIGIRKVVGAMWEQDPNAGWQLTGTALALGTWPIYVVSLVCAVLRIRVPHLSTPKEARGGRFLPLVLPQVVMVALLLSGILWRFADGMGAGESVRVVFALMLSGMHWAVFYGVWEGWRLAGGRSASVAATEAENAEWGKPATVSVRDA